MDNYKIKGAIGICIVNFGMMPLYSVLQGACKEVVSLFV
jgi:hypothetical protein